MNLLDTSVVRIIHRDTPEVYVDGILISNVICAEDVQLVLDALSAANVDYDVEHYELNSNETPFLIDFTVSDDII